MEDTKIVIFKGNKVRKVLHKGDWWFSILDIIAILANTPSPKTYWSKMKARDPDISQPFPFWEQLKLVAEDGKMRDTDCAN
jgi:prophage antirepressor-like protein